MAGGEHPEVPDRPDPARMAFEQAEADREAKAAEKKSAHKKVAGEATKATKTVASHTAKGAAGGGGLPGAAAGAATGTARAVLQSEAARSIFKRLLIAALVIILLIASVQFLLVSQTTSASLLAQQETTGSKGSEQAMKDLDMSSFSDGEDGAKNVVATKNLQILQDAAADASVPWQVLYSVLEMQHEGSDGVGPYQVEENKVPKGQKKAIEDDFEASTVFVAEEISKAAKSTSGVDGELDIGSGTKVDENEKLLWPDEDQFEEEIYEPWSKALAKVPLEGADDSWGRDVIEAAVQLRFGKKSETDGACPTGPGRGTDEGGGGKGSKVGTVNLNGSQMKYAETIVQVGRALGFSEQGQVVALMVAFQESTMRNLDHGDRDSLGLFQQRPSMNWGTADELTDPVYASTAFYLGVSTNPGLEDIKGWEDMEPTVAAQSVQRSGYPDAYAQHEPTSRALLKKVVDKNPKKPSTASLKIPSKLTDGDSGGKSGSGSSGGGGSGKGSSGAASAEECGPAENGKSCKPTGMAAEKGLQPDAKMVLRCAHAEDKFFKPYYGVGERPIADDHPKGRAVDIMIPNYSSAKSKKRAEKMANYLMKNRRELGVKYLIYRQKIWNVDIDKEPKPLSKWRGMEDRGDDTQNHHDHIHVSVFGNRDILH